VERGFRGRILAVRQGVVGKVITADDPPVAWMSARGVVESVHISEVIANGAQEQCAELSTLLIKAPQEISAQQDIGNEALGEFTGFFIAATALPDVRVDGTPVANGGLIAAARGGFAWCGSGAMRTMRTTRIR
jgi:hypothetical protein